MQFVGDHGGGIDLAALDSQRAANGAEDESSNVIFFHLMQQILISRAFGGSRKRRNSKASASGRFFRAAVIFFSVDSTHAELAVEARAFLGEGFWERAEGVMRRSSAIEESPSIRNEALRAFHVDDCIPRLYIAHGFMRHNRASQPMFRFRLLSFLPLIAGALFVLALSSEKKAATPAQALFADDGNKTGDHTKTGIDVLEAEKFAPLRGKRVGLITNQTGLDSYGHRTIDLLARAEGVNLVAIFSPEHGIAGWRCVGFQSSGCPDRAADL